MLRFLLSAVLVLASTVPAFAGNVPSVAVYGMNTSEDLSAKFNELSQSAGSAPAWGWTDPAKPRLTAEWGWTEGYQDWIQTLTYFRPNQDPLVVAKTLGDMNELFSAAFTNEAGTLVAGTYRQNDSDYGESAFVWDEQNGYRSLKELLIDEGIGDPSLVSQLQFNEVTGMTADGRYLFGMTFGPTPGYSPFLIDLRASSNPVPEPSTVLTWMAAVAGAMHFRRRANRARNSVDSQPAMQG